MRTSTRHAIRFALLLASGLAQAAPLAPDTPIACDSCAHWNRAQAPFQVYGNTYYVGTRGLAAVLIVASDALVLVDGALPQSAALIAANIRALGFRLEDLKLILNSHAHFDHAGGLAALARDSRAPVAASEQGAAALMAGTTSADDPQAGFGASMAFAPLAQVRGVRDGEVIRLGSLEITAVHTPGHTPGATTWRWRSCEAGRCLDVVYADSLTAVSAPGFRFGDAQAHPGLVQRFERSIATVAALPCDVLLSVHPEVSGTFEKLERRTQGDADAFIDPQGCKAYAEKARVRLAKRLAEE